MGVAWDLAPRAGDLALPPREVARLACCGPDPKWNEEIRSGIEEARALIAPRARWLPLEPAHVEGLFSTDGPVAPIARRGDRWAFVATIGERLELRVREHFGEGRFLRGLLLDAAGSVAVEALCDLVERCCAGPGPSTRFSPGYCMWRLDDQRRLLGLLGPETIGVRLLPSMLMQPLKSVSGLVVRGAGAADLEVPIECCAQCDATGCRRRGGAAREETT